MHLIMRHFVSAMPTFLLLFGAASTLLFYFPRFRIIAFIRNATNFTFHIFLTFFFSKHNRAFLVSLRFLFLFTLQQQEGHCNEKGDKPKNISLSWLIQDLEFLSKYQMGFLRSYSLWTTLPTRAIRIMNHTVSRIRS